MPSRGTPGAGVEATLVALYFFFFRKVSPKTPLLRQELIERSTCPDGYVSKVNFCRVGYEAQTMFACVDPCLAPVFRPCEKKQGGNSDTARFTAAAVLRIDPQAHDQ